MKKLLGAAVLAVWLLFVGCGSDKPNANSKPPVAQQPPSDATQWATAAANCASIGNSRLNYGLTYWNTFCICVYSVPENDGTSYADFAYFAQTNPNGLLSQMASTISSCKTQAGSAQSNPAQSDAVAVIDGAST